VKLLLKTCSQFLKATDGWGIFKWPQVGDFGWPPGLWTTKVQAIRRAGSAALDLAYLAAGRFDGFWELKLKPWDTAAGCLMVTEAGGAISDIAGVEWKLQSPSLLASNGLIQEQMIEVLSSKA